MLKPIENWTDWQKRYGISAAPVHCPSCRRELELTVPIAYRGYRGLAAKDCSACGTTSEVFRVVPVGKSERLLWEGLAGTTPTKPPATIKLIDVNSTHRDV